MMLKLKYFFIFKSGPPFKTISYALSLKVGIKIIIIVIIEKMLPFIKLKKLDMI